MKTAPISVIIPAHNEERFVAEAIRSVQQQSLPVSELFVIANGCNDRTAEISAGLGAAVIEVKQPSMAAALNRGIRESNQPWIAFLDADDYWHPKKIELQWKAIERFPDTGLVACDCFTVVDGEIVDGGLLRDRWVGLPGLISTRTCRYLSSVEGDFFARFYLQTPGVMVRRDALNEAGLVDENFNFWQMTDFFSRVLRYYPLAFVEKPLAYQRIHDRNHTRDAEGYWSGYRAMIRRMLEHPDDYPPEAGRVFRECLKRGFHTIERELARTTTSRATGENIDLTAKEG
jgi:glycosyltransferase involved in cell wall biosynthesis